MQKCNYCGYVTKYSLDKCPSCGATQYTKLDSFSQYEVEKTPTIDYKTIIKPTKIKHLKLSGFISISLIVFCIILLILMINDLKAGITKNNFTDLFIYLTYLFCIFVPLIGLKKKSISYVLLLIHFVIFCFVLNSGVELYNGSFFSIFLHIPTCILTALASFYCLAIFPSIVRSHSENMQYNSLKENGILVKNLNYIVIKDKNNSALKKIVVKYITKDNVEFELESKQSFYTIPKDNTVDLLIDKTNFNNYFIDFEIN